MSDTTHRVGTGLRRFFAIVPLANKYPALHGLRLIAIILVVQVHVSHEARIPRHLWKISQDLWWGMDFFFIMSGFLIGTILLRMPALTTRSAFRFYLQRSLRLFPAYYVAYFAIVYFRADPFPPLSSLWRDLVFVTNYFGSSYMHWNWSLSLEEHFYLIVPGVITSLMAVRSHRGRIAILLALFLLAPAIRLYVVSQHDQMGVRFFFRQIFIRTHMRFDILVVGVLMAYLVHYFPDRMRSLMETKARRWTALALVLAIYGTIIWKFDLLMKHDMSNWYWGAISAGFLTGIGGSIITVWGIYGSGFFHRILSSTATRYVATLGYGVYLFHLLVVKKITNGLIENVPFTGNLDFLGHWLAGLTATLLISYVFAYALHLLVEKPSLYLRRRLT